jgi:hypothetical protein
MAACLNDPLPPPIRAGAGTEKHPTLNYFHDKGLVAYDVIVLAFAGRLEAEYAAIVKHAVAAGVPFIFVNTKLNSAILSVVRARGVGFDAATAIVKADITESVHKVAASAGVKAPPIFFTSVQDVWDGYAREFDEPVLAERIAGAAQRLV